MYALQDSIDRCFKDRGPIQQLIDQLRKGEVDPMIDDFLIINVGVASVRAHGLEGERQRRGKGKAKNVSPAHQMAIVAATGR